MIPARYSSVLFGFFLSGLMSCLVSGISTLRVLGFAGFVPWEWMQAWAYSWVVAFPAVLLVAPLARRIVARLVKPEP
ncbi:MAG: DUF2798 domain-containing protein [Sedimentitalea sp.]